MRHFEQELGRLKEELLEMSTLVESAIYQSDQSVVNRNEAIAQEVLKDEGRVNQLEIAIDDHAISLLALQAPLAADLRLITVAIRINTDLERMGDLSVSIAQSALALIEKPVIHPLIDIPYMSQLAHGMVRKAIDSFLNRDPVLAYAVLASDDAVDSIRTRRNQELIGFMESNPHQIPQALLLVSRPQVGANCRSCHQHCRGRAFSGQSY